MTAVISIHCRKCGTPLRDRFSRTLGYGPECRKDMTAGQIADAVRANQPGYVPTATPPVSLEARRNHAEIQRVTAPAPAAKRCVHEDTPATCALCRRDNDPKRITDRIIALVQRIPMDQRLAAQKAAAIRRYNRDTAAQAEQLTIGTS
jgi:hypothetical protein